MQTRFFRAGVGTVIYNDTGEVVLFERATHPVGVWEFQQGGIDKREKPNVTLWRELQEEIGLAENDFETVTEVPGWHAYEDKDVSEGALDDRIGQTHRWFFLKLKTGVTIDISRATEDEVSDYKWVSFEEAIAATGQHKRHIYENLYTFYLENIEHKKLHYIG